MKEIPQLDKENIKKLASLPIDVKEKLPKTGIRVLFYTKYPTKEFWFGVRWYDEWEDLQSCRRFDNSFVTHWAPLPNMPK